MKPTQRATGDSFRVAVLSQGVGPPWADGMINVQVELARCMADVDFEWFGRSDWQPAEENFFSDGSARSGSWGIADRLRFVRWMRRSEADIDHLIFHPRPVVVGLLRRLRRSRPAAQTIQTMHHAEVDLGRVLAGDHLIAVTERIEHRLCEHAGNRPVTLVRPAVDADRFQPGKSDPRTRKRYGIPPEVPLVVYSGNYTQGLGATDAARVFTRLAEQHSDAHFVFATRERKTAESRSVERSVRSVTASLQRRVTTLGLIPDFHALLAEASLLVFPASDVSQYKLDLPLVLLEAMALGIPIGVYDIEPLNELRPERAGFVVGRGDVDAFGDAAADMLANPTRADTAGTAGRQLVLEEFTPAVQATRLRAVYDSLRS